MRVSIRPFGMLAQRRTKRVASRACGECAQEPDLPYPGAMKRFSCGDVVPGCTKSFSGETEDEILAQVAAHARDDHAMASVGADVVEAVKKKIRDDGNG